MRFLIFPVFQLACSNSGNLARGFSISFESPKSDKVALFTLGERSYDHLLILPAKSKGTISQDEGLG
jgi:hypothetical protein